jgi:hypothetical protein
LKGFEKISITLKEGTHYRSMNKPDERRRCLTVKEGSSALEREKEGREKLKEGAAGKNEGRKRKAQAFRNFRV